MKPKSFAWKKLPRITSSQTLLGNRNGNLLDAYMLGLEGP